MATADNSVSCSSPGATTHGDDGLRAQILSILDTHLPQTKQVRVTVADSRVILTGEVGTPATRQAIAELIRQIPGVTDMTDAIVVSPDVLARLVSENIERKMISDARWSAHHVTVHVEHDQVTLSGRVPSLFDHDKVEAAARLVPGVGHVVNRLCIMDQPP